MLTADVGSYAKSSPGTEYNHGCIRFRLASADHSQIAGDKAGQRPGDRFKIVDNVDIRKAEAAAKLAGSNDPWIVGEGATFAFDYASHAEQRMTDRA